MSDEKNLHPGFNALSDDTQDYQSAREEILARRCRDLEDRLTAQTHILTTAAQELAAEIRRREELQSALVHAQKLEALGYLTSSVAHDVNNVLQAISFTIELLAGGNDSPRHLKLIDNGRRAIDQGLSLTRRLLTFA